MNPTPGGPTSTPARNEAGSAILPSFRARARCVRRRISSSGVTDSQTSVGSGRDLRRGAQAEEWARSALKGR